MKALKVGNVSFIGMVTAVRRMEVCEATAKKSGNRLKLGPLTRTTLYQPTLKGTKTQTTDFRYNFLSVFILDLEHLTAQTTRSFV